MLIRWAFIFCVCYFGEVKCFMQAFDADLYERVLNAELCDSQLSFLASDPLLLQFLDASAKFPTGFLAGNIMDLGNYYQCLGIDVTINQLQFEGKYCAVSVDLELVQSVIGTRSYNGSDAMNRIEEATGFIERGMGPGSYPGGMLLSYCIPKVCTVEEALNFYSTQIQIQNITYTENFCRLPNDKPYAPADYVAFIVLGTILLLTIVSTTYDLIITFIYNEEPDQLKRSFSIYTNTRRFLSFPPSAGTLECLDGIRSISMIWVVVGHTYVTTTMFGISNTVEVLEWTQSWSSVWITSAGISVDTFLMLSGVLCTYTTLSKVSKSDFVRNIPLFYLNRLLRLFPLLGLFVLLQASVFHRASDGPLWGNVAALVDACREHWWSALIHVQNYVNPHSICLGHTWYLSVDIQLYLVCPLVLVFLFGRRLISWTVLTAAVLLSLTTVSIYTFMYNFQGIVISDVGETDMNTYMQVYYYNTLTRAPPFFAGMAFGFLLHITRSRRIQLSKWQISVFWLLAIGMFLLATLSVNFMSRPEYTSQGFSNFFNAYVRTIWALALGWVIVACQHGYGGPVNWLLSLRLWKLPARLSYAVYLVHSPLMWIVNASWVTPHHFSAGESFYRFLSDLSLATIVSFAACVTVDAPFCTLQKMLFSGPKLASQKKLANKEDIPKLTNSQEAQNKIMA